MDLNKIDTINFENLTSEEASQLGLNSIFQEANGTYDWIYCMDMLQDKSMMKFVMKIIALAFVPFIIISLIISEDLEKALWVIGILALCLGAVMIIIVLSFWFTNALYKGKYMMVYQMNNHELVFSQTSDQAKITKMLTATYSAVSAAGQNIGGTIAGAGLTMSPNAHHAVFAKVRSVKGKKKDNLIWVNSFFQHLMVYVPAESYDFVWEYITQRCVRARISED